MLLFILQIVQKFGKAARDALRTNKYITVIIVQAFRTTNISKYLYQELDQPLFYNSHYPFKRNIIKCPFG